MAHYLLAEPLGTDVVLTDAPYEGIRLCHAFSEQPLQASWSPRAVTIQRRAQRAELMCFLRNAPAVTSHGAAHLAPLVANSVEFLPLRTKANQPELFALNALVTLPEPPATDDVPVFRLLGATCDGIYFSEGFKTKAQSIGGGGGQFVSAAQRYPQGAVEAWEIASACTMVDCDPPASSARMAEAEVRIGLRFPESLRWLFAHVNGGRPSDDAPGVSELLALRDGRGSAEWTYELLTIHFGLVPWTWFPFAHAAGGDTFFVDCSTKEGAVFLCRHDTAYERIQPFRQTLADFVSTIVDSDTEAR
jgi:hypothetical protein